MQNKTIGILGAGKVGTVLGQLAVKAGYNVLIAGSGPASKISLTVEVLVPGAKAMTADEVSKNSDIVILALPLGKYKSITPESLAGKLVIDAMNYWWEVDGIRDDLTNLLEPTSVLIQKYLLKSTVVKAFNHMGYHDLFDENKPVDSKGRKAIAIAGDDQKAIEITEKVVNDFGFDPVYIGRLADSQRLEPGSGAFGANETVDRLNEIIEDFRHTDRGQLIQEAKKEATH